MLVNWVLIFIILQMLQIAIRIRKYKNAPKERQSCPLSSGSELGCQFQMAYQNLSVLCSGVKVLVTGILFND